jgi:mersacidin/lichenicidin family type 2 lantibiotic
MEITKDVILRAWREEGYLNSPPESTRTQIPARPTRADGTELSGADLEEAAGGGPILVGPLSSVGLGSLATGSGRASTP